MKGKIKTRNTIWIDRAGGIIWFEFLITGIFLCVATVKILKISWAYGVIVALPITLLMAFAFFKITLFRWTFCLAWSVAWGYLLYCIVGVLDHADSEASYVLGIGMGIFMLYAHRDEYLFEKSAEINVYDHYK